MTANAVTSEVVLTREQLRTFHLTGTGPDESTSAPALRPTILASFKLPELEACYPMCVHPDGRSQPLRELLADLEHGGIITSALRAAMNGQPLMLLSDALPLAIESLVDYPRPEIARLSKLLPPAGFLVAFHMDSVVLLHAAALAEVRGAQRKQFWDGVRHAAARLRELLLLDAAQGPGAVSAESVNASLGSGAGGFFNPAIMASALQGLRNPVRRMSPERRSRCETTLEMLNEGLHDAANHPEFWLFHSGIFGTTSAPPEVVKFRGDAKWAVDSFAAAMQFCDLRLDRLTHLLRALRVARLELDSAFDPQVHEEMLARFDWQSASASELYALPPIVVIETADYFGQASLSSFGKLLRSGRPVQVLILRGGLETQDLTEFTPDFGYVSIAHRESFVLQSSLAAPSHLMTGLKSMAQTLRPAVAVVAAPRRDDEERQAWLEECLLVLSRTFPLYRYDPGSGDRWADRFRLEPSDPIYAELTAAHAAALSDRLRKQFRLLTPAEWNGDQMELAEYMKAYTKHPPLALPYLWVEGNNGTQQRALLTRDLVNLCVDRRRAWALFDELATPAKPQPVADSNARQEGAREAIERVIAMLAG